MSWLQLFRRLRSSGSRASLQKMCETASVTFPPSEAERVLQGTTPMFILPPKPDGLMNVNYQFGCFYFR